MQWYGKHKVIYVVLIIVLFVIGTAVVEFLMIKNDGIPVLAPMIPREKTVIGHGRPLRFAILGDSTSIGQGGDYDRGIAVSSAKYIADKGYEVTYQNFGISGARVQGVLDKQTTKAVEFKPDVVLLAIGANDVTHLTKLNKVESGMSQIVDRLRTANPDVKIVITGSPQMGSVPRFPQPVKWLAKVRTGKINAVFTRITTTQHLTFAHIADKTGPTFLRHPELFAQDNFHPTTAGYAVWQPVLNQAIDTVL